MGMFVTYVFLLELFILMPHAVSLSTGLACDRTKQNPVRNDTSMAIVACLNCRECPAGYEPQVPCGKIIGIYDPIGSCRSCPDGTYSSNKDTKSCKICQKKKCFKHQLFDGKCERDKHDQSYCLNECEMGYKMNKRKTACHIDASLMITTTAIIASVGSNIPKATSTMTQINTTKEVVVSQGQASSGVNTDLIIIIVVIVIGIGVALVVWYCYRKWKRSKKTENFKPVSSDNVMSPGMSPQNSPVKNNLVTSETPVHSPANVLPASLMQSTTTSTTPQLPSQITLTQNPLSFTYVPKNSNGNHMGRLNGDFPYEIYSKICEYFDTGTLGRDWRALAGWLGLSVQEVERIKNQQYQTHEVIQTWGAKEENDLKKFLQILTDKKMTQLVADINKELVTCRS